MALNWKVFTQRPYIKSLSLEEQVRLFNIANEKSIKLREQRFIDFANSNSTSQSSAGDGDTGVTPFTNIFSLDFDGTDDYVDGLIGESFPTSLLDNFSVSFWIKMEPVSSGTYTRRHPVSVSTSVTPMDQTVHVRAWNTQYRVRQIGSQSGGGVGTTDLSDNNWHHIVYTYEYDAGTTYYTTNIYVDGNSTPEVTAIMRTTGGYATRGLYTIGVLSNYTDPHSKVSGTYFPGEIDEVAGFDGIVLTTSQINSIYNSGVASDILSLSPKFWYRFEEGSGTTATDSGIGSNNGTINGAIYSTYVPT